MAVKTLKQKGLTWVNIDKMDEESFNYLKTNFKFHHLDYEDLRGGKQTPKIDIYKNYLFLILHIPQWKNSTHSINNAELGFFIGEGYLITIQHGHSKLMKNFFYRCMKNPTVKKNWMDKGSGYLMYKIIDALFHDTQPIIENIGKQIFKLEENIFKGEQDSETVKQLAIYRRNILRFRRIIDPQRYLISNLSHIRKNFLDENLSIYFDDINDYLSKIWSITDTYKDTIDGLHVTVDSLMNHKTNKTINALTVISVALMPLTLFSGIYGMNVTGLPHAEDPIWVWLMFLGLAAIIVLILIILKKRKWL